MAKIHLRAVTSDFYVQDKKKSSSMIVFITQPQYINEYDAHKCKLLLQ